MLVQKIRNLSLIQSRARLPVVLGLLLGVTVLWFGYAIPYFFKSTGLFTEFDLPVAEQVHALNNNVGQKFTLADIVPNPSNKITRVCVVNAGLDIARVIGPSSLQLNLGQPLDEKNWIIYLEREGSSFAWKVHQSDIALILHRSFCATALQRGFRVVECQSCNKGFALNFDE